MQFELGINRRNVPDQVLLDDLVTAARRAGTNSPTTVQYREHGGRYHPSTIIRRFSGWGKALSKANLKVVRHNGGIDCAEALLDLRRVAAILQPKPVTASEYEMHGRFSPGGIAGVFGSWNRALREAGLIFSKRAYIPTDELFRNLEEVWRTLGRQPKYSELEKPLSQFSAGVYDGRFGSWRKALEAFVAFANCSAKTASGAKPRQTDTPVPRLKKGKIVG